MFYDVKGNGNLHNEGAQFQGLSESVSSTDDGPISDDVSNDMQVTQQVVSGNKTEIQKLCAKETSPKTAFKLVFGLFFILIAIFTSLFLIDGQENGHHLVPT